MSLNESINQLFNSAREKDEFNFICTLINYKGMGSKDFVSNLPEWFNALDYYKSIYENEKNDLNKVRIGLLIYCTFFESSDFYNILGNLSRNILGFKPSSYLYWKHDKSDKWLGTGEKISLVTEILLDSDFEDIVEFFNENHYKEIRNTFFHFSYSLADNNYYLHDSEPIYINRLGSSSLNISEFILPKIDNVITFYNSFKEAYISNYESYTSNKKIIGHFPNETEIIVIGSESGLAGFIAGGSYVKLEDDFWSAMNIRFDMPSEVDRFINDEIQRLIVKESIRTNDGSLQHLYEVITERNRENEKKNLSIVYERFAEITKIKGIKENNHFKQVDLYNRSLSFYQKALNLDSTKSVSSDMAIMKYMVSGNNGNKELRMESLIDLINCMNTDITESNIKNSVHVIKDLKGTGENIEKEKNEILSLLKNITDEKLEKTISEAETELNKI